MCGRYSQTALDLELLKLRFGLEFIDPEVPPGPRFNMAPTQNAPVVVVQEEQRQLQTMRWGLVPFWAKDEAIGNKLINARAETLKEKPSFRNALKKRRCLVLADGFYEWVKVEDSKKKQPMRFVFPSRELFAFAGLYEHWKYADGNTLRTFTIITTAANDFIKPYHHRMPVILKPENEGAWLDPEIEDSSPLEALMADNRCYELECYPVSTMVNSPGNENEKCIEQMELF